MENINNNLENSFIQNKKTISEIYELTLKLTEVNKKLEESEAMKSHFLSNIRNEIINPFTSILGLSSSVISMKNPDWTKMISMVTMIYSEAFNLNFQLKNIFAAAEIEAGESIPQISESDIHKVIYSLIENFWHIAEQKKIKIHYNIINSKNEDTHQHFNTDAQKVEIIFGNIISNALKYSLPNTIVKIDFEQLSDMIILSVKDQGIGIEDSEKKRIFDRFHRLNNSIHTLNNGHGLGLSIVKDYTELLNGKLILNNKIGVGTEFRVEIPESKIPSDIKNNDFFLSDDAELF